METVIQYIIIALVFLLAVVFLVKRFVPSKNKQQGCKKGCGCSMTTMENKDTL